MESNNIKQLMVFSAVDKYIEENKVESTEKEVNGYEFIEWGENNIYPTFINDVFQNSPTLKAICQSVIDYTIGNGVSGNNIPLSDERLEDIVSSIAYSYVIYGGFALNILRNRFGDVADVVPMDMRNIRSDKKNTTFYYSENYGKKSYGRCKYVTYPKFDKENKSQFSSIFYYKNTRFQTYSTPIWSAAVNAALIEYKVGEYHLNNLANGFSSNVLVSLNNGLPNEQQQLEIEENFNEKFCGSENSGRVVLAFSPDKEHAPTIDTIDTTDFADKYNSLIKYSREQLFASFRMNPNLCGIATESNGFNSEEYDSAYRLFNRVMIRSFQKVVCNSFDKIFGTQDTITITPFTLDEGEDNKNVE